MKSNLPGTPRLTLTRYTSRNPTLNHALTKEKHPRVTRVCTRRQPEPQTRNPKARTRFPAPPLASCRALW